MSGSYREWEQVSVDVAGDAYAVATKPGVPAHGSADTASILLGQHVRVAKGDTVVYMNCGNGLAPAVGARANNARRIVSTERSIVSVEAARRTLAANPGKPVEIVAGHGAFGIATPAVADVVAIRIPHEKLALVQLLYDAFRMLKTGGVCYISGANNEGIKSATKLLERAFGNSTLLAYDSGHRIVSAVKESDTPGDDEVFESPFLPSDAFKEIDVNIRDQSFRVYSRPGVFSWDHLDEATQVLAGQMMVVPGASVLDLGCGSGPLGILASRLAGGGTLTMVDADVEAVRSAKKSADAAGVADYRAMPSDVAGAVIDERFDLVVTNPPFHLGKHTELSVPMQFIEDAWEVLSPGGQLFLVANRTLPYETPIRRRFGNVLMVHDGRRFKVLTATKT
ncbi:MAG TPA: methyltransferase [Gemmatimonadaceae bacterium]|nr:methyltransferase [Gemmatimonadaceae bacterium]